MTTITGTQANQGNAAAASLASATPDGTDTAAGTEDRFLKLLVTQMQNQDPLNPMDNAQVTSQMAQINTVTGIDKLKLRAYINDFILHGIKADTTMNKFNQNIL